MWEFSIHVCMQKSSILLATHIPSILIDPECSTGFSTNDKYQKPHVLVAMLFTIFTRTYSGPYTISWLECRQTNMFDAKTVILYWTSNITNVHSTTVPMWNPCWSINGHKSNTSTSTLKAACATPYKGISGALWEGNHLSEHGCPLAGATGHAY